MGAPMAFARNAEIYGENEPADYIYKVVSGTVRTYKVLADGRRQIGGFYLPGDIFGFEAGDDHTFSAEAVSDTKVLVIKRSAVVALAGRDGSIARELWALTARELRRVQDHVLLLIQTAQERVASFLLEMAATRTGGQCSRADDVAPGHRRLSRPHDRDGLADAYQPGKCRHHRGAVAGGEEPYRRRRRIVGMWKGPVWGPFVFQIVEFRTIGRQLWCGRHRYGRAGVFHD